MSDTKRRIRTPETRRADLLEAASELLIERGLDAVSVADITNRAGVAKGTFYLYFDTREALLDALRTEVAAQGLAVFSALRTPATRGDWPAFLDELVDQIFEFFSTHPLHDILAAEPHRHSETAGHWPLVLAIHERLGEVLAEGASAGAVTIDPEVTPAIVFDLLHDAWHLPVRTRDAVATEERVRRETKRVLRAALLR